MGEADREGVGFVGPGSFREAKKSANHKRHLVFVRRSSTDSRLFDSRRRVLKDRQATLRRRENRGSARRAEHDRGLVTLHVNDRLESAAIRLVLVNQLREAIPDRDQTRGRAKRLGVMNDAKIKNARFSTVPIDHGHAGIAQGRVDRKNAHPDQCARNPRMRRTPPIAPRIILTNQYSRRLVRAEIAAMAIAIWKKVTPCAKISCR